MLLFTFRRPRHAGFRRTSRELRPAVSAFESRLLMSGATTNGIVTGAAPMSKMSKMVSAEVTALGTDAAIASLGTPVARKH
jgi:hypothetical protein